MKRSDRESRYAPAPILSLTVSNPPNESRPTGNASRRPHLSRTLSLHAESIGAGIRKARDAAGKSQAWLATQIGVQSSTIIEWEKGRTSPAADELFEICELLNVSADAAMGKTDSPTGLEPGLRIIDIDAEKGILESTHVSELRNWMPVAPGKTDVEFWSRVPPRHEILSSKDFAPRQSRVQKHVKKLVAEDSEE